MQPIRVSADDPRLDDLRSLQTRRGGPVVIEGETFVGRAVASGLTLRTLVSTPTRALRVAGLAARAHQWLELDAAEIGQVVGFTFHRGVLGIVERPPALSLSAWLDEHEARPWRVVLVQGVADPANLGAIVRNARALEVDLVVADHRGADPWGRKAIRAAAGHVFAQPLVVTEPLEAAQLLARAGAALIASTLRPTAQPLRRFRCDNPRRVWMVGNEGHGLSPRLVDAATSEVRIDMAGGVDSLNVAAATAVLLWADGRRVADP